MTPERELAERLIDIHDGCGCCGTKTSSEMIAEAEAIVFQAVKEAVEKEREACALIADINDGRTPGSEAEVEAMNIAEKIRRRGE